MTKLKITTLMLLLVSTGAFAECKQANLTGKWVGAIMTDRGMAWNCEIGLNKKGQIIPNQSFCTEIEDGREPVQGSIKTNKSCAIQLSIYDQYETYARGKSYLSRNRQSIVGTADASYGSSMIHLVKK